MYNYNDFFYKPTDLEDELFLSEAPINIIQSSINIQFDDPLEYRKKDYVQSFITKYEFSKENSVDEELEEVDRYQEEFIKFMIDTFENRLKLGFPEIDNMDPDDQNELIHLTYRFFIKNIKKNFITLIWNYINDNKTFLLMNIDHRKDVTTLNFKTEIDDEDDISIISNLSEVIDTILDNVKDDGDIDEFFKLCMSDEVVLELEYMKKSFNNFNITGNFIDPYIDMVDDNFRIEIESKIRNKILKKYPKRNKKIDAIISENEAIKEKEREKENENK